MTKTIRVLLALFAIVFLLANAFGCQTSTLIPTSSLAPVTQQSPTPPPTVTVTVTATPVTPSAPTLASTPEPTPIPPSEPAPTSADDKIPLTISGSSVNVSSVDYMSATIVWTTNEPATSQVVYGKGYDDYGLSTNLDNELVTNHRVTLLGLYHGTNYYFRVKSKDRAGNEDVSANHEFRTMSFGSSWRPAVTTSVVPTPELTTPTPKPTPSPTPAPIIKDLAYITAVSFPYSDDADPEYEGVDVGISYYDSKSKRIYPRGVSVEIAVELYWYTNMTPIYRQSFSVSYSESSFYVPQILPPFQEGIRIPFEGIQRRPNGMSRNPILVVIVSTPSQGDFKYGGTTKDTLLYWP